MSTVIGKKILIKKNEGFLSHYVATIDQQGSSAPILSDSSWGNTHLAHCWLPWGLSLAIKYSSLEVTHITYFTTWWPEPVLSHETMGGQKAQHCLCQGDRELKILDKHHHLFGHQIFTLLSLTSKIHSLPPQGREPHSLTQSWHGARSLGFLSKARVWWLVACLWRDDAY